jgi:hypothetical protein
LKSSHHEQAAVAAVGLLADHRSSSPRARRPSGTLVITPVSALQRPKRVLVGEGACIGVLTVGECRVAAMDGHYLGLAAWILNARGVTVSLSKSVQRTWRVKSNAHLRGNDLEAMCYSKKDVERDQAWFVKRFEAAFYAAHNPARQMQSMLDYWGSTTLPRVLKLVPPQYHVNVAFGQGIEKLIW